MSEKVEDVLPYSHYFYRYVEVYFSFFFSCLIAGSSKYNHLTVLTLFFSGVIGSGVCVFSRYPIIDAFTYRYSLNGYMYNITHGDWFGGKAVGYCVIDHPKQPIHLFATHVS